MRLLVITSNPGITPSHRQEILTRLRREGLMVRNARIASDHIELDVVADDEREVRLVERLGLNLQEVRVIDMERTINYDVHDALFKYVELFNKERFWEAHEVLEGVWRLNRDKGLQGLIILAAAFVKLQENNPRAFEELMTRAKDLIKNSNIPINKKSLLKRIDNALRSQKPFRIESADIEY
jgi:predicted metal-dependent hydrolase